ncbi:hypothetical protein [Clostridium estertheticum]|uniref:Uncharacterized protein n=1 Tax=Clostridium estertheticum TaxID=238834 RepID=A0AA47ENA3_9CLOT|nr:hypothetical protein [Clostridium estertheticum]MBU3157328.1 hypothetical protein [Clostridium estertheticum]WAG62494.1 hypothetical protein LL038_09755 [Clostridium estertheticum]
MNKSRNIIKKAILIFCIAILPISFSNRAIYGTWNVFAYPNRVTINGYRYDNNGEFMALTDNNKPKYEVSTIIDRITFKRVYSNGIKFMGNGKSVFLYLGADRYLILRSGGGA